MLISQFSDRISGSSAKVSKVNQHWFPKWIRRFSTFVDELPGGIDAVNFEAVVKFSQAPGLTSRRPSMDRRGLRKQYQRCNDLQLVGTYIPSSAAMVTGIFTQRRYSGGEEDTVFTVSNQSKRLKK